MATHLDAIIVLPAERKTMKAVLIDSKNRTVTDVEIAGDLASIYAQIGCHTFATAASFKTGDDIFVDDEGLLDESLTIGFHVKSTAPGLAYPTQPFFAGNGLLVGHNRDGEPAGTTLTAADLRPYIQFAEIAPADA